MITKNLPLAAALVLLCGGARHAFPEAAAPAAPPETGPARFAEIWAYLMQGEEKFLDPGMPITDIAYFSARLDSRGELYGIPPVLKLGALKARKHLVVAEVTNQALTHFVLSSDFPLRDRLVNDIASGAVPFDGVQIDFEAVPAYDKENFLLFLSALKDRLGGKTLTVALPARRSFVDDAYDYGRIAAIVDRIVVMAYDEHWSGSEAGSIASLAWSGKVSKYAYEAIGGVKLVMGLPFYGRAWGDKSPAGAYKFSSAERILKEKSANVNRDAEGIPFFRFSETVNLILYFEDRESILKRANLYRANSVSKIGFWRLGQEDPAIWRLLEAAPETGQASPPMPPYTAASMPKALSEALGLPVGPDVSSHPAEAKARELPNER